MQKEQLVKYIENPEKLGEYSLADMRTLLKKYPFFQLGYFLFLLNLKNIKDPRFDEYLSKYAVYIKDRNELFRKLNYIESSQNLSKKSEEENNSITKSSDKDSLKNTEQADRTVGKKEKQNIKVVEDKGVKKRTEEKRKNQYTRKYLSDRISKTLSSQINEAEENNELREELQSDFFILDKADSIKGKTEIAKDKEQTNVKSDKGEKKKDEELLELDNKHKSENKQQKKKPAKGDEYFEEEYLKEIPRKTAKQNKDLIDKFIEQTPEIKIKQPPEETQKDISEEFVKENDNLLSEKLAKLYIKQGYYNKAIDAFEKLSLKYPEKSNYFAEQIQKVKQIINEQQK
ncbi:MAG: hypothetical protein ACOCZ4_01780 [Bacteroidota bacterium]